MSNSTISDAPDFARAFEALTGHKALMWQQRLLERGLARGDMPPTVTLPTGLGKTSVIPIWLIALAQSAQVNNGRPRLPRRLVYIVNRRTVVDQATDTVMQMRQRLLNPGDPRWSSQKAVLQSLADGLRRLGGVDDEDLPLAVSTLRGELADNAEWRADPARPAIIIGTVDMIGSKLLFSGYGDGRSRRAHHAGLIGQDTLIVHDEAHLTPAFSALLTAVQAEQERERARNAGAPGVARPTRVMELSATSRPDGAGVGLGDGHSFGIEPEDARDLLVQARLAALKRLSLIEAQGAKKDALVERIIKVALGYRQRQCRVLIYARRPEVASDIAERLRKQLGRGEQSRVGLLTGTIRGYERDLLAESDLFKAFKADPQRPPKLEQTLYLVSTSAGEVGVDLDADHLVCDLTTLDSMIQRLGRVNRLGVDRDGRPRAATITVVVEETNDKDPLREQLQKTAEILRQLPSADGTYDASPQALDKLLQSSEAQAAFAPSPQIRPASDILFDAWSLTSVRGELPGRPQVAEYLHGVAEWEPPETFVAWRAEVRQLADAQVDRETLVETLVEWFEACPILSHERLRDRTDRVRDALQRLLKSHRKEKKDETFDVQVVLLSERGEAELMWLSELAGKPDRRDPLPYATVVLPTEVAGLSESGMLDEATEPRDDLDVAEKTPGHAATRGRPRRRERWLFVRDADGERWKHLLSGQEAEQPPDPLRERKRVTLREPPEDEEDEGPRRDLVLLCERGEVAADSPEHARFAETLLRHSERVAGHARRIATALNLPAELREALVLAARWHDRGKDRPVWQRYARNPNLAEPLAKSHKYGHGRELGGYRHEFGSLLQAAADPTIRDHSERELILHLIAAHHDWARPHFEPRAYDNQGPPDPVSGRRRRPTTRENEQAAVEAMQRFGRLQQRFGRWGLAWLESLLRCADAMASRAPNGPSTAKEAAEANRCTPAEERPPITSTGGSGHDAGGEDQL